MIARHILLTRLLAKLRFRLLSPLHIGLGERGFLIQNTLLVEKYVIPASSLKGSLRRIAEWLMKSKLESYTDELVKKAVQLHREERGPIEHTPPPSENANKTIDEIYNKLKDSRKELFDFLWKQFREDKRKIVDVGLGVLCPVCSIFGCPSFAGKMRLTGAKIANDSYTLRFIWGVGINRETRTAERNVLFAHQVIDPGVTLCCEIIVDNLIPGDPDAQLFADLLKYLHEEGFQVGARKSVGLGCLDLDVENSEFAFADLRNKRDLESLKALFTQPYTKYPIKFEQLIEKLLGK